MNTTYKPGDQVVTKVNGVDAEASIVRLSVEVEVKTSDGKLWWRALSRVWPATALTPTNEAGQPLPPEGPVAPLVDPGGDGAVVSGPGAAIEGPSSFSAAIEAETVPQGVKEDSHAGEGITEGDTPSDLQALSVSLKPKKGSKGHRRAR